MLPKKYLDQTVGLMMSAWKDCQPFAPDKSPITDRVFTGTNYFRVALGRAGQQALKQAVEKCGRSLDLYPLRAFEGHLQRFVADAREANKAPGETSLQFRTNVNDFFKQFDAQEEWEVVMAVTGFSDDQPAFTLGPCRFFVMDATEFHRWGQRARCGRYDPPAGTQPLHTDPLDDVILGNWTAAVRVPAVDQHHANSKTRFRLEEVLNALRYGTFQFGRPHNSPRTGLGKSGYWNNHSLCMRVKSFGGFTRSSDGAEATNFATCGYSVGWSSLVALVSKEGAARTGLEATVSTALEWVGQAAGAALAPVRLVALVTAMEVLVMGEHESLGKKAKLSQRVGRIVADVQPKRTGVAATAERLYRLRSECLHEGVTQVEEEDIETAYHFVAAIFQAYLTKEPYCKCPNLAAVLALLEPVCEWSYEI